MELKVLRQKVALKQFYISDCLDIKTNTYSQWENGTREPPLETIPKLAKIFNCSIEEVVLALLETKENKNNERKTKQAI